jgi:hypothetical protein
VRLKGGNKQNDSGLTKIAVIEQRICFLLGVVCIAFGILGICMERGHALPAYIAWLGSAYEPTLRGTAIVCLGLGVALVYRGRAQA